MRILLMAVLLCIFLSGCADVPIKNGELVINDHTGATMDGAGIARVNNRF